MVYTILHQSRNRRLSLYALAAAWLLVNLGWFSYLGIRHGGDSLRYIYGAATLLSGKLPEGKSVSYVGYQAYVALMQGVGLGEVGVVVGQVIISGVATWCLYRLTSELYHEKAGILAALFFILWLKLHPWNMFILTDSLFISVPIIATWLLNQARTWWHWAAFALLLVWITLLRPEGITYLAAVGVYGLYWLYRRQKYVAAAGVLLIACASLLAVAWPIASRFSAQHAFLVDQYALGAVIWDFPPLYLTMPGQLPESITAGDNSLAALADFIAAKPLYFLQLAGGKILLEIIHIRPFYTPLHNAVIVVTLYPLYVLAVRGLRQPVRDQGIRLLLLAFFATKLVVVGFTFADWSGRFLIHVLPVVVIFAAAGGAEWLYQNGRITHSRQTEST